MGGGGGGGPTQSTVTQTNIPEYLQPQIETLAGAATQQLFNTVNNPDGTTSVTGARPFVPYGANVARDSSGQPTMSGGQLQYLDNNGNPIGANQGALNAAKSAVAGFSPLQQQVQGNVAQMSNPGQFNTAMGMTQQQANNSFTDPSIAQQFMNPYLMNSLAPQMQLLNLQQGQQNLQNNAQATQAGAFGGSRMGVQNAMQNMGNQLAMSNLVGQGYNTAYNTGMQQYNTEQNNQLAAANQLANIAGMSSANQQSIYNMQNTIGGQQQQQNQNIINQAINNYAQQQQAPSQALNQYSALLHGYAVPGQTVAQYQAPPSMTSSLTGLGLAGMGVNNLMSQNKAKGGVVKGGSGLDMLALRKAMES